MAGHGAGPSRRSHTKSRKGCKTCKRRHIRCDETFPQCRNCTKHQVRCDYMDAAPSDSETQSNPDQTSSLMTSTAEETIRTWQQTGEFPYKELDVYPPPQVEQLSRNELHFIHNLSSISESLTSKGLSAMTIWTPSIAKFLSLASSYPYVMHALHSLSANHLSFTSQSSDLRKLSIQHGGVALRGLHEAISNFSASNADGVLAASLVLTCQATDYRSWSSLEAGILSVVKAMSSWKHESLFTTFIDTTMIQARSVSEGSAKVMPTLQQRYHTLQNISGSLQNLRPLLSANSTEEMWFDQIIDYVSRLQASEPAQTPEEQFNHLYVLRKWLYWLPIQLLENANTEGAGLLVVAYLYATALELEPLFPDIGPTFCTAAILSPLEEVIGRIAPVQTHQAYSEHSLEIASIMQFPQAALQAYRERNPWTRRHTQSPRQASFRNSFHFDIDASAYNNGGNLSPAFAPSQLHLSPSTQLPSRSHSPFLELPTAQYNTFSGQGQGFSYGTGQWGAMPSPNFPSQEFGSQMELEDQGDFGTFAPSPFGGFGGGSPNIDNGQDHAA